MGRAKAERGRCVTSSWRAQAYRAASTGSEGTHLPGAAANAIGARERRVPDDTQQCEGSVAVVHGHGQQDAQENVGQVAVGRRIEQLQVGSRLDDHLVHPGAVAL